MREAILENHDYEEPYFEPASEEESLIRQLKNMSVPVANQDELKYVHRYIYSPLCQAESLKFSVQLTTNF